MVHSTNTFETVNDVASMSVAQRYQVFGTCIPFIPDPTLASHATNPPVNNHLTDTLANEYNVVIEDTPEGQVVEEEDTPAAVENAVMVDALANEHNAMVEGAMDTSPNVVANEQVGVADVVVAEAVVQAIATNQQVYVGENSAIVLQEMSNTMQRMTDSYLSLIHRDEKANVAQFISVDELADLVNVHLGEDDGPAMEEPDVDNSVVDNVETDKPAVSNAIAKTVVDTVPAVVENMQPLNMVEIPVVVANEQADMANAVVAEDDTPEVVANAKVVEVDMQPVDVGNAPPENIANSLAAEENVQPVDKDDALVFVANAQVIMANVKVVVDGVPMFVAPFPPPIKPLPPLRVNYRIPEIQAAARQKAVKEAAEAKQKQAAREAEVAARKQRRPLGRFKAVLSKIIE
jgi:hypothetical protein